MRRGGAQRTALWDRLLDDIARRSVASVLGLWLGMVLALGVAYWAAGALMGGALVESGARLGGSGHALLTAIYFSFVTATSVGFGDVVPTGALRILAVVEAALGLLLFGAIVSKFVSRRQEALIEEIHLIAYEDHLGRVRTNLHLVLSELQAIGAQFASSATAGGTSAERLLPRLESVTIVFSSELRTVHGLLYRPQRAPDEAVLEGLLANLAAILHELSELLAGCPRIDQSASLRASRTNIARLASEICGECVPHDYTAPLKLWMDRVQDLAQAVAPPLRAPSRS